MVTRVAWRKIRPAVDDREEIEALSAQLGQYFHGMITVEWEVACHRLRYEVSCHLHSRSGWYRASTGSRLIGHAARQTFEKLVRQRRRIKERSLRARRRARTCEAPGDQPAAPRQASPPRAAGAGRHRNISKSRREAERLQ